MKVLSGLLPFRWWWGDAKHQKYNMKQLEMKLNLVYHKMDALKEEIMKELVRGEMPSREFRLWLDKGERIEHQFNTLFKAQTRGSVLDVSVSSEKLERLMSMLEYEIANYLEVSPVGQDPGSESSHQLTRLHMKNEIRGSLKKLQKVRQKEKTDEKAGAKPGVAKPFKIVLQFCFSYEEVRKMKNKTTEEVELKADSVLFSGVSNEVVKEGSDTQGKGTITAAKKVNSEMKNRQTSLPTPNIDEAELYSVSSEKHQEAEAEAKSKAVKNAIARKSSEPSSSRMRAAEADLDASAEDIATAEPVSTQVANDRSSNPSLHSSLKDVEKVRQLKAGIQIASSENRHKIASPEARIKTKKSTKSMVQKIIQSKAKIICLCGQGGIGKTSIVRALVDDPKLKQKFDPIIWVTVSRCWSTKKIQEDIVRQLPFYMANSWSGGNTAASLFQALQKENFLLILDDVWEKIDLNEVGIPRFTPGNGSKLIMTTRSVDVCHDMAAEEIQVASLSSEESWELFREQVGQTVDSPDIEPYAREIVNECGGLPLSIIVAGKALSGETDVSEWKLALKYFLMPNIGEHGVEPLLQHLSFCYERLNAHARKHPKLTGSDLQTCFAYCGHFPEDFEVNVLNLIEYWIEEGIISGNFVDLRQKGHDIVEILINAGLLESTKDGVCAKMRGEIRELASRLISAKVGQFTVQGSNLLLSHEITEECDSHEHLLRAGAGLTEPPPEKEWEAAKIISLEDNDLSSLPSAPNCPNLLRLSLQRNTRLRVLPMSFFDRMPRVKVLNMSKTRITTLPSSIENLQNLIQLNLRQCERLTDLPPELGKLKLLELLDLHGTVLNELPEAVGKLKFLKDLEVSFYGPLDQREHSELPSELIPCGILSNLHHLNNLSIDVKPGDRRWSNIAASVITEMHQLSNLTSLKFYFPELQHLMLFQKLNNSWINNSLQKFSFIVGFDNKRMLSRVPRDVELDYTQHNRQLRLVNEKLLPQEAIKKILAQTTSFYLDHHLKISSLSQFGARNVLGLEFCVVRECPAIKYIIDGEEQALPFLEYLSLHYLEELNGIWNAKAQLKHASFASLKCLSVYTCWQLEFVFTDSMSQSVPSLEELVIGDCQALQNVISVKNPANFERPLLPKMKKLRLSYLPNLISIWRGTTWPSLENVSFYLCPKLKNLNMGSGSGLKESLQEIKAEKEWWDLLDWDERSLCSSFLQNNICNWI